MKQTGLMIALLALVFWSSSVQAQLWSGQLPANRATDWSSPGATIVNRTTICATIAAYGTSGSPGNPSTITNAINACTNGVVKLGTGTFHLSNGITFADKNNITLRGDGPHLTRIIFYNYQGCNGFTKDLSNRICIRTSSNWAPNPSQGTLSGNFAAGSNSLTLTTTATPAGALAVGRIMVISQDNDTSDNGYVFVCQGTANPPAGCSYSEGGGQHAFPGSGGTQQAVVVTNIVGTTVTFSPALKGPHWTSSKNPKAFWGGAEADGIGIEDLAIDGSIGNDSNGSSNIAYYGSKNFWLLRVESYGAGYYHLSCRFCVNGTIRDSYFERNMTLQAPASYQENYGIGSIVSTNLLIENNIFHKSAASVSINGSCTGCVIGYNYSFESNFFTDAVSAGYWSHEVGNHLNLLEGNDFPGIFSDGIHGSAQFHTFFRNYSAGFEAIKTGDNNSYAVSVSGYNRMFNVIGNVLGKNGYATTYESVGGQKIIFNLGPAGVNDPRVAITMMRWGNYDTVTDTSRFLVSEVPTGLAQFAVTLPASTTLPSSYYLSSRPSWFGYNGIAVPFPPIGPDVIGGFDATLGSHVHKIPARLCYENTAKDGAGRLTAFNPALCYASVGGGDTTPPAAPQNPYIVRPPLPQGLRLVREEQ